MKVRHSLSFTVFVSLWSLFLFSCTKTRMWTACTKRFSCLTKSATASGSRARPWSCFWTSVIYLGKRFRWGVFQMFLLRSFFVSRCSFRISLSLFVALFVFLFVSLFVCLFVSIRFSQFFSSILFLLLSLFSFFPSLLSFDLLFLFLPWSFLASPLPTPPISPECRHERLLFWLHWGKVLQEWLRLFEAQVQETQSPPQQAGLLSHYMRDGHTGKKIYWNTCCFCIRISHHFLHFFLFL